MEYNYDLVSGNVHRMSVQTGSADHPIAIGWHHAYSYDADNRITEVHTSTQTPMVGISMPAQFIANEITENPSIWDLEAKYFYYAHGPLARTELGDQLQGLDYIYNLQGWLKGINATSLDKTIDPGKDGVLNHPNQLFSKDVMAFSLHYYNGDYKPIGGASINPAYGIAYGNTTLNTGVGNALNLYNGNIRFMQTTLTKIDDGTPMPMLNAYKYDQLNRLLEARSYTDGLSGNEWNPTSYNDKYFNKFTYDANGNILTQKRHNSSGTLLDDLTYNYLLDNGNLIRNRLYHVNDAVLGAPTQGDLEDQGTIINTSQEDFETLNNYKYDAEGRLIQDLAEGIQEIVWRVDGKVKKVNFTSTSGKNNLEFDYDAFGRRIAKHVHDQQGLLVKSTYYILDASGNQLLTYEHVVEQEESNYQLAERVIYGSSRLGLNTNIVDMLDENPEEILSLTLGNKLYEMSNHLGNVLTVINDIKVPQATNSVDVDGYLATIVSTADYSPFGVQLDGRTVSASSYRYGFNGMEKDDEMKGAGNSYDFGARILDPRLGRWMTRDPHECKYPAQSSYTFSLNSPILYNDPNGKDAIVSVVKEDHQTTYVFSSTVYLTGTGVTKEYIESVQLYYESYFGDKFDTGLVDDRGKPVFLKIDITFVNASADENVRSNNLPKVVEQYANKLANNEENQDFTAIQTQQKTGNSEHLKKGDNVVVYGGYGGMSVARFHSSQAWINNYEEGYDSQGVKVTPVERAAYATIHETLHLFGLVDRYDFNSGQTFPGYDENWMGAENSDIATFKTDLENCISATQMFYLVEAAKRILDNSKGKPDTIYGDVQKNGMVDCDDTALPEDSCEPDK